MDDTETVTWFGMDSISSLECTKADLIGIGELIKQLTAFVWTHNAEILMAVEEATTVEEVEAIIINYSKED